MKSVVAALCCIVWSCSLWAVSLVGTYEALERENEEAALTGLAFIECDPQLERFKRAGLLVPLPVGRSIVVDPRLEKRFHFVRPWTAAFLQDLGERFFAVYGKALQVNSAVRTLEYQKMLLKTNGNAAPLSGWRRSVHPTGAAIDIAKLGRTEQELAWLRWQFLSLEKQGFIEATEEHFQQVFHVMVFIPH